MEDVKSSNGGAEGAFFAAAHGPELADFDLDQQIP
jgi:hypothetical protein